MHTVTTAFDESPRHCHVRAVTVLSVTTEKFMSKPQQISDCSRRCREPIRRAPSSDSVGRRASCTQCRGCVSVLGPCHARACHRFHCRNPSNLRAATTSTIAADNARTADPPNIISPPLTLAGLHAAQRRAAIIRVRYPYIPQNTPFSPLTRKNSLMMKVLRPMTRNKNRSLQTRYCL